MKKQNAKDRKPKKGTAMDGGSDPSALIKITGQLPPTPPPGPGSDPPAPAAAAPAPAVEAVEKPVSPSGFVHKWGIAGLRFVLRWMGREDLSQKVIDDLKEDHDKVDVWVMKKLSPEIRQMFDEYGPLMNLVACYGTIIMFQASIKDPAPAPAASPAPGPAAPEAPADPGPDRIIEGAAS